MTLAKRRWILGSIAGTLILGLVGAARLTATTKQGVNYALSVRPIPVHAKLIAFLDRHYQYQALADEIAQGCRSDEERALAVFEWTREHLRKTPPDWSIVDDHVLNIIIRGHGVADQFADVFTVLTMYAGVPAFWQAMMARDGLHSLCLSFVRIDGVWRVFDVGRGLVVRDAQGRLATVDETAQHPEWLTQDGPIWPADLEAIHQDLARGLAQLRVPETLRPQLQMPGPRVWYELRRLARWTNGRES